MPAARITEGLPTRADDAPTFSIGVLASVFLGRTAHWLRWQESQGVLTRSDGTHAGLRDEASTAKHPPRVYPLDQVEEVIEMLFEAGKMTQHQRHLALLMVKAQAGIWGMFENPFEFEGQFYDLSVEDVARMASRSPTWVRQHAESLGGVKRRWSEGIQETWRFPQDGLDEEIFRLQGDEEAP